MGGVEDTAKGFVKRYEFKMTSHEDFRQLMTIRMVFNIFCRIQTVTFYVLMLSVIYIK